MFSLLLLFHVLGACIWAGGHLVLCLAVLPRALRARDPRIVADFERGFEKLGIPALVVQVLTGPMLALHYLPNMADWFRFQSVIADHVFAKLALLTLTVLLAAHARLRVLPQLDESRLHALAWHIVPVTVIAVLMVILGVGLRTGGFAI